MSRFLFGPDVENDLRQIRDHIGKDSPKSARLLMVRFLRAFRLLAKRPQLGHMREDLLMPALRFWPVESYLVIYLADKQLIEMPDRLMPEKWPCRISNLRGVSGETRRGGDSAEIPFHVFSASLRSSAPPR